MTWNFGENMETLTKEEEEASLRLEEVEEFEFIERRQRKSSRRRNRDWTAEAMFTKPDLFLIAISKEEQRRNDEGETPKSGEEKGWKSCCCFSCHYSLPKFAAYFGSHPKRDEYENRKKPVLPFPKEPRELQKRRKFGAWKYFLVDKTRFRRAWNLLLLPRTFPKTENWDWAEEERENARDNPLQWNDILQKASNFLFRRPKLSKVHKRGSKKSAVEHSKLEHGTGTNLHFWNNKSRYFLPSTTHPWWQKVLKKSYFWCQQRRHTKQTTKLMIFRNNSAKYNQGSHKIIVKWSLGRKHFHEEVLLVKLANLLSKQQVLRMAAETDTKKQQRQQKYDSFLHTHFFMILSTQ